MGDTLPPLPTTLTPPRLATPEAPPKVKKPAAKRKPHRKSRTGCKQCRASRVKCDETKPCCSYCTRHSVQCSYLSTEPNLIPVISSLALSTTQPDTPRKVSDASASPLSDFGGFGLCNHLHMKDLELLLHFTSVTGPSLALQRPAHISLWATVVPQEALEHPFLMYGVLAISALHLAHLHIHEPIRHQEYALLAAKLEAIALPLFRAEATAITERNCPAVFAFSSLQVIYSMGSPEQSALIFFPGSDRSIDRLPTLVHLLRGVDAVVRTRHHMMRSSRLQELLQMDTTLFLHNPPIHSDELALNALANLYTTPPICSPERVADLAVYQEALALLRSSFSTPETPMHDFKPMPHIWFARVSDEYLALLNQRKPEALVLLAYVCVIMKRLEPCWFCDGTADRLMANVLECLHPEWRFWIEWPLREMGWDPFS